VLVEGNVEVNPHEHAVIAERKIADGEFVHGFNFRNCWCAHKTSRSFHADCEVRLTLMTRMGRISADFLFDNLAGSMRASYKPSLIEPSSHPTLAPKNG
jgi:hypothetical protein